MNKIIRKFVSPDGEWTVTALLPETLPQTGAQGAMVICLKEREIDENEFLDRYGLLGLIESAHLAVLFPQMRGSSWSVDADVPLVQALLDQAGQFSNDVWHDSPDRHYLLGEDSGATLCYAVAMSEYGTVPSAICAIGGQVFHTIPKNGTAVPVLLIDAEKDCEDYFVRVNHCGENKNGRMVCPWHPTYQVWSISREELSQINVWTDFFDQIRRVNTSVRGDVASRASRLPAHAVICKQMPLSDGREHDWIEIPPPSVRTGNKEAVPLIMLCHGMGDTPAHLAEQTGMHLLGERDNFITIYAGAGNGIRWNLTGADNLPDDNAYLLALIEEIARRYPVDRTRIYVSGFSNGAGMAMMFALNNPEVVAAACPIDSTFPYATTVRFSPPRPKRYLVPVEGEKTFILPRSDYHAAMAPLEHALQRQKERKTPLVLPVMYFYGSRESEYPVRSGSNQELNYRFWKAFNGIPQQDTDDALDGEEAVGVLGNEKHLIKFERYPMHSWTDHVFRNENGLDVYHFVLMHGKAHDVHPCEAEIGWHFVSRFARCEDGRLMTLEGEIV